ncbi:sickle tail protein homolog isoform X3 [Spea bombifrons]|uniref:sickle tail protein homolog isoform X3 n=1 Tax=Spea bombifrons TaxID=233779 RepID=UPI0023493997|nr:sickle tail protein homolog isoform X3 [Spea bombifrons]
MDELRQPGMATHKVQFFSVSPRVQRRGSLKLPSQTKNNIHGTSLEDKECHQSKENLSNGNIHIPPKSGRNIPRRHTVGGPRSSKEILGMQTSEMDRKREAFLEHLKYKYPHHATAIMGHQERLRDQTKSPKLSPSPQPSLGEQAEHLSEASADSGDAMFEGESMLPFVRGSRTRASLPVVRSTNQTKERSLGVLFLQYGEDTKKLQMPNEITSFDTIRALFVSAFPQQLTMKTLESPSTAIYIKDEGRNIYYELSDVRNIQDRSFLKVYNKDPAQAFNHTPRTVNGDIKMQRDISYSVREGPAVHRPGSATYPSHAGPISPPTTPAPHSMPPSPSRIPYGGGRQAVIQSNNTMQRDRIASLPASRSISPSPSAILERRDVKPDEDLGNKNLQMIRNDTMYTEPYLYHEGRMSIASSHGGHPLDVPDHVIAYHRGALRSASTYTNSSVQMEMMEQSMYRQKTRKHSESHLPTLGSKTPPVSPHRVTDIRMMDIHPHNTHVPPHAVQTERSSPLRQSFKKDQGAGVFVEAKMRNTGGILGVADVVPSPTEKTFGGYGAPPKDPYTRERMQAMEKQIASLTGLVQTALLKGPGPTSSKDAASEKGLKAANSNTQSMDTTGTHIILSTKNSLAITESTTVTNQTPPARSNGMQVNLHDMRRNVVDLRLQLHKLRQLQLQNQETVRAMMKKAEMEISSKLMEMVKSLEDPVQRQRILVEQERQKYLNEEEQIITKLCDLESFVDDLKKDLTTSQRAITLKDVEDRAFMLRKIGEAVSNLKGEFPYLQSKMRAVLRVEVEAVRFLKEEPHKLDSMLKRIRNMTDALSALRRHVTDGPSKSIDFNQNNQYMITEQITETEAIQNVEDKGHAYLQPTQTEIVADSQTASVKSEVVPLSAGVKVHQVQSLPVHIQQSQHSSALVNHSLISNNQSSNSAVTAPQEASAGLQTPVAQPAHNSGSTMQSLFIEEIQQTSHRNRALSIEEAERKFEEKRQNLDHYNGKEFEKMLEEAQANIMKSIPSLEMPSQSPKVDANEKVDVTEDGPDVEQDNSKVMKSPPPPPPRRIYPPGPAIGSPWTPDATYIARKDNSKECEEILPLAPSKTTKAETEDQSSTQASVVKDDEEEEEGERIMAELQAFQKCSVVDVNSKGPTEYSKSDTQDKDLRPASLAQPSEKKVSKEYIFHESPKPVEIPDEKWNLQNIQSPAPDSGSDREGNAVLRNEKSTYSLFIGKAEHEGSYSKTRETQHDKESKHGDDQFMTIPGDEQEKKMNDFNRTVTESGLTESKTKVSGSTVSTVLKLGNKSEALLTPEPLTGSSLLREQEMPYLDVGQTVVLRPKNPRRTVSQQSEDSPTTSPTELKSPADNIAFMITKTEVQLLSTGEVQDIVSRKGDEVQTVNLDRENAEKIVSGNPQNLGPEGSVVCTDKKPVIIIFDEPMDIKSAYKRLSTIFEECDDDLEKMMSEGKIEEEEEEEEEEESGILPYHGDRLKSSIKKNNEAHSDPPPENKYRFNYPSLAQMKKVMFEDGKVSQSQFTDEEKSDTPDYQFTQRQDAKKKFKFKFPKKQLVALTQAIRTGTKTGKKTLQVVVYEEEEEPDGTVKQHKEAKRFEIARSKSREDNTKDSHERSSEQETLCSEDPDQSSRTDEIRKNTYKTLDSLEQTIKQLESTISEMSPKPGSDHVETKEEKQLLPLTHADKQSVLSDETKHVIESPSIPSAARKGSNGGSQTSRMPVPMSSKIRQGSMEKNSKQPKLQEPQRQYRQANGGTKKAGGDYKATSPTLSVSKIPAPSNTGKSSSVQCIETSNSPNQSVKSHVSLTNSNTQTSRTINASSIVRSAHNGPSKLQSPTYTGKGHHLSFSLQTPNGRPSPPTATSSSASSSPSSSVSPTSLTQGMKTIRTIHTPSFTSYKSQNGNAVKTPPSKETSNL